MLLEVFFSYSHKDEELRDELEKQLALLKRQGLIVSWHDRRIGAGEEWRDQINAHVHSAHIILLLISADFIASEYCYGIEMKIALERQRKHEAVVIPVILRPVHWSGAPFAKLQALPRNGIAVTKWDDRDDAFTDVAKGVREVVTRFQLSAPDTQTGTPSLVDKRIPKPRVVDAVIPSHVVKDAVTKLLVLIRLPDSPGLRGILQSEKDAEARPQDVRSKPFKVIFPLGPTGEPEQLKVAVKVTSPDFTPPEQIENIYVPPDADSEECPFLLTPRRVGRLEVLVKLQWEEVVGGHRSLVTKCVADSAEAPPQPEMNLVQMPVAVGAASDGEAADATSSHGPGALPQVTFQRIEGPRKPQHEKPERLDRLESLEYRTEVERLDSDKTEAIARESSARVGMPAPVRLGSRPMWLTTRVIIAIIGAIPLILGSYWQFVYKPQHFPGQGDSNKLPVIFTGQVLNAHTKEFVPDARITVALEAAAGSLEQYTDSHGNFSFHLDSVKRGTEGRIYVHAPNYDVLEKNFVITGSSSYEELRLEPLQNTPSPPKSSQTRSVIAGRVVDPSTNAGVSHAGISLAGRSETYLTDDNGNFRIRLLAPFASEDVRLQVKKAGCAALDQVVRPPAENLMLELRCKTATPNHDSQR